MMDKAITLLVAFDSDAREAGSCAGSSRGCAGTARPSSPCAWRGTTRCTPGGSARPDLLDRRLTLLPEFHRSEFTRDGKIPDVHEVPCLSFSQGAGIQGICVTNQRYFNEDLTYQWQDPVSKIAGKHSIRAGFEINQWYFIDQNQASNVLGSFDFSNRFTGYNFADFLLGVPSTMSRTPYAVKRQDLSVGYDFFFQDNYKITNSLTLNLGVRYEYDTTLDGMPLDVIVSGAIPAGNEEDCSRLIVSIVDITERKKAEQALSESEELFSNAFEFAPIGKALFPPMAAG